MPIYKDDRDCYLIESGIGDIEVGVSLAQIQGSPGTVGVLMVKMLKEAGEVGRVIDIEKEGPLNWEECPVVWAFRNVESVDAVVGQLGKLRKRLVELESKGEENEEA